MQIDIQDQLYLRWYRRAGKKWFGILSCEKWRPTSYCPKTGQFIVPILMEAQQINGVKIPYEINQPRGSFPPRSHMLQTFKCQKTFFPFVVFWRFLSTRKPLILYTHGCWHRALWNWTDYLHGGPRGRLDNRRGFWLHDTGYRCKKLWISNEIESKE